MGGSMACSSGNSRGAHAMTAAGMVVVPSTGIMVVSCADMAPTATASKTSTSSPTPKPKLRHVGRQREAAFLRGRRARLGRQD